MKKVKKMVLTLAICFVFSSFFNMVSVAAETEIESNYTGIMPISKLQTLFPEKQLQDNGYINNPAVVLSDTENYEKTPVDTLTRQYDDGECTLVIYNDGSYDAYGYERLGNGSIGYSSGYTAYWRGYATFFNMSYTFNFTNQSNGYSKFTSKGLVSCSWSNTSTTNYTMEMVDCEYTRQTQTSNSAPAVLYGRANCLQSGNPFIRLRLTTTINKGVISVTGTQETT